MDNRLSVAPPGVTSAHLRGSPLSGGRWLLALASVFALVSVLAASGVEAAELPDTQFKLERAMEQKSQEGGGTVVAAPGVIEVEDLRVPDNVILRGSGTFSSPRTTLRLKPKTNGQAVMVGFGTTKNGIENVIVDGNRRNQSADRYQGGVPVARPSALIMACNNCTARYVQIKNAMYDGMQVSSSNGVKITKAVASVAGRSGFTTTSSARNVDFFNSRAFDTGIAYRSVGSGPGFLGGGKDIEFRKVTTRRTNGDGIAAYASTNSDIKVYDSRFYNPKNHCAHLGGDKAAIMGSKCYDPRLVGFFIANDWRPGAAGKRDAVGGRILGNYVEGSGSDGIKVQWYVSNTQVKNNTVIRSHNHNYGIYDSRDVAVTGNTGRWPGPAWCHLKISNSRISASDNNFDYSGRTRPITC